MRLTCGLIITKVPAIVLDSEEVRQRWEAWADALESGKYRQVTSKMRTEEGFCSIGVAADLYPGGKWNIAEDGFKFALVDKPEKWLPMVGGLDREVREWYGNKMDSLGFRVDVFCVEKPAPTHIKNLSISGVNDFGATFREIADIIRKGLSGGYVCEELLEPGKLIAIS